MTVELVAKDVASLVNNHIPEAVVSCTETDLLVKLDHLGPVAKFLKQEPSLDFSFLIGITAVDYVEYFELIYHLRSMKLNQSMVLKARAFGRDDPVFPSLVELWPGADLQAREIGGDDSCVLRMHFDPGSQRGRARGPASKGLDGY